MTYRWEPTTPLDRILATGFKRMDEAVERVIADHVTVIACELFERDFAEALACDADMPAKVDRAIDNLLNMAAQQAATANRQGLGNNPFYAGIGDQHAQGSPFNQLGAAYRNAIGGGI